MNDRYGPFHRKKSPTQTYVKPLCAGLPAGSDCVDGEGIEFTTRVRPSQRLPSGMVVWSMDQAPVDGLRRIDDETIALTVAISKIVYSEAETDGVS